MTKKILLSIFLSGIAAKPAYAFQSSSIECGLKFIVPPLLIGAIVGIIALIMTIIIALSKKEDKGTRIFKWWIIPLMSITMVFIASNLC